MLQNLGFSIADKNVSELVYNHIKNGYVGETESGILTSLDIILQNAYEKKFSYFDVIKGQLSNIYALIMRGICDIPDNRELRKKPSLVLDEIRSYILDNLCNKPTSEDIASQFSKSPDALDKLCISECGMSVSALKKQIQFEKIKSLLTETEYTLDEISDQCGFADRFTMGKFFKKNEGMPPGEYRKSYSK